MSRIAATTSTHVCVVSVHADFRTDAFGPAADERAYGSTIYSYSSIGSTVSLARPAQQLSGSLARKRFIARTATGDRVPKVRVYVEAKYQKLRTDVAFDTHKNLRS
ncbi:hypothetical protein EVAR_38017_1 [Eumeta japonica]|uniref:Uncharacterized protein n=1 Tax=Eumeta variegata TaxID=151549 RepID=A0A4C1WUC5_EUMVA|nr:hypothetical protein EVAR_38017_1 [Eumeta japonica]